MLLGRLLAPALALVLTATSFAGALAQVASPAAGTPAPENVAPPCAAAPRDVGEIVALWFTPSGTPAATPTGTAPFADLANLPEGVPADDATVQAITDTTRGWISCLLVYRQFARAVSYLTDHLLAQSGPDFANPAQDTAEEVRALLEGQIATPAAAAPGPLRMPPLAGPRRVRLLGENRAGAVWSLGGDKVYIVYQQQGGRWLIDDVIDVLEPAATPAATPAP